MRRTVRRLLVVAVLGGMMWASQRWWRQRTGPIAPVSPATPWPPVPTSPGHVTVEGADGPAAARERVLEVSATLRASTTRDELGGAAPIDGRCPDGYPVKGKDRSRIYHLPGMAAYDRTVPDRCYPSASEAEADGFRRAKH